MIKLGGSRFGLELPGRGVSLSQSHLLRFRNIVEIVSQPALPNV
jgi:hypothetical protein